MSDITMKRGDTRPPIVVQLTQTIDGVGSNIDLTTVLGINFWMRLKDGTGSVVGGACTLLNAPNGLISYQWTSSDTNVAGVYVGEFEITWPGPYTQTVPSGNSTEGPDTGDFMTVELVEDIDGTAPVLLR